LNREIMTGFGLRHTAPLSYQKPMLSVREYKLTTSRTLSAR
jgi:hypothetical protein